MPYISPLRRVTMLGDDVTLSDMGRKVKGVMAARALRPKRIKVRGGARPGFPARTGRPARAGRAGRVTLKPGQRFRPRYSPATNPDRAFVPGEVPALADRHYAVGYTPTMEDIGLGKKKSFFKRVLAKTGKVGQALKKSTTLKSSFKVIRGAVGFKKGLTAKQLKASRTLRKGLVGAAVVAGAVVFGPAILAKGAKIAKMGAGKFGKLFGALSKARKDAGLPPVTAETFAGSVAQQEEAAAASGAAPSDEQIVQAASEQITQQMEAQPARAQQEAAAFERSLVTPQQAAQQIAALPPAEQAAAASAASEVSEMALPGGGPGLSTMAKVGIGVGVVAAVGAIYYATRKGKR